MPERYAEAIIKYLSSREYQPLKPRQLARQLGVSDQEYGTFREAVKLLRDAGRIVLGAKNALTLPEMSNRVIGAFRANPRGFGFVIPETPNAHGDLYIPEGEGGGAMSGDTVVAEVFRRGMRGGEMLYHGRVKEILRRGASRVVGTLRQADDTWFVLPDGTAITAPVVIADVPPGTAPGQKVVAEIVAYPTPGELARGVIAESLGAGGQIEAETLSVVRAFGLSDEFPDEVMDEARRASETFDPASINGGGPQTRAVAFGDPRENLEAMTIVTIDPPDARDFDDAISIEQTGDGFVLGVHIADVSHFVREGGALDREAKARGNSVYFPRKVLPMLPGVLSNGVCSLQQGQRRFCKSAFIRYDRNGEVAGTRFAETVIRSVRRLTYTEAQSILDGKCGGYEAAVVDLLGRMQRLAEAIEQRRRRAGMLHLDLPEVELVLDDSGKVVDAVPEDDSYTHTVIEMFMVEANEAVAGELDRRNLPFLRRIHPDPDAAGEKKLASFVRVCGHRLPRDLTRRDIQQLLATVKGKPQSHAVNLAVLKSFQAAEYSPMRIGHFALASSNYCHFTSPIRRYADLTVHRLLADALRQRELPPADLAELVKLGMHLTTVERRAENAERELRAVLILQLLAEKVGETFEGVVDGVTNFGIFVELRRYGIDGLIRMNDLGDDWWEVSAERGEIRGERSGRRFRIGDPLTVRVASVSVAARQLNLVPAQAGGVPKRDGGVPKRLGAPATPARRPARRRKGN